MLHPKDAIQENSLIYLNMFFVQAQNNQGGDTNEYSNGLKNEYHQAFASGRPRQLRIY